MSADGLLVPPGHDDRIENPLGGEIVFEARTAAAGGGRADDAFSRFGGDDLRVLGPPLAVSHPL